MENPSNLKKQKHKIILTHIDPPAPIISDYPTALIFDQVGRGAKKKEIAHSSTANILNQSNSSIISETRNRSFVEARKEQSPLEEADLQRLFLNGKKSFEISDYADRIIFRTCVNVNNVLYQISMRITNDEILNFYVRRGSENDKMNKFSIDITTLCKKAHLERQNLVVLCSYVLRNILVIKDEDVCYFDFSKPAFNAATAMNKITGLLKGVFVRKKLCLRLKNLVCKKKIRIEGLIYTCLLYMGEDRVFLRLVKGWEVLAIDLNLAKMVRDGMLKNFDKFFKSLQGLGLKICEKDNRKTLQGLEKYRL